MTPSSANVRLLDGQIVAEIQVGPYRRRIEITSIAGLKSLLTHDFARELSDAGLAAEAKRHDYDNTLADAIARARFSPRTMPSCSTAKPARPAKKSSRKPIRADLLGL